MTDDGHEMKWKMILTVVQVAGEGGIGEDEVVEVGVLLEFWKISSSKCEGPGGEAANNCWAGSSKDTRGFGINPEFWSFRLNFLV